MSKIHSIVSLIYREEDNRLYNIQPVVLFALLFMLHNDFRFSVNRFTFIAVIVGIELSILFGSTVDTSMFWLGTYALDGSSLVTFNIFPLNMKRSL